MQQSPYWNPRLYAVYEDLMAMGGDSAEMSDKIADVVCFRHMLLLTGRCADIKYAVFDDKSAADNTSALAV